MKNVKKNGGFTLVELIVVIAILAILAAVAIPAYSGYIAKAEKANDLQLLGAINTAFGSACMENGFMPTDVKGASFVVDREGNIGSSDATLSAAALSATEVTYIGRVTFNVGVVGCSADELNASFAKFFTGNEGAKFNVLRALAFDPLTGTFSGYEVSENVIAALGGLNEIFKDSVLSADEVINEVQDLTNVMENAINGMGVDGLNEVLGGNGAFTNYLTQNGVDTTNPQEIANHAALFVAGQVAGADQDALKNAWSTNGFAYGVGNGATGIELYKSAGLSTMGAMAMYYANMEACVKNLQNQTFTNEADQKAQQEVIDAFNAISTGMESATDAGKAMEILMNGYDNMFDAASKNTAVANAVTSYGNSAQGATDAAAALAALGQVNANSSELKDLAGSNDMYGSLAGLLG